MDRRMIDRVPIFTLMIAALIAAAVIGIYLQHSRTASGTDLRGDLMRSERKPATQACENASDRGRERGKAFQEGCEEKPPKGKYGTTP